MYNRNRPRILTGESISELFHKNHDEIKSTIDNETESYILNVNDGEYANHLEAKYKITPPEIHFDQVYADSYEKDIPAEYFPNRYNVETGQKYRKEVIQYFIPCSGDVYLLKYRPGSLFYMGGGGYFDIIGNEILTEFINFSNNAEELKLSFQNEVKGIQGNYGVLIKDINDYNFNLRAKALLYLSQRKQKLLTKNNLLSSLGVPLKKNTNVAATFAVPKPTLREKIIVKPIVNEKGFKPEPTLDIENYNKILKLINDVGKNFERMPSLYKDKGEEDLRDHILMTLDPNFEYGSASGETFNKSGKTDIQLRHDSSVVFIAECKFWSGEKNYLETISQLLAYLTWRDTKASVIVFVKQNDFSAILEKVNNETNKHINHLGFVNKSDENWFNFRFHLNGDKNREVKLAVQLYHLPKSK